MNANTSHLHGAGEKLGGLGSTEHRHTSRSRFTSKSVMKSPNENIAHLLCAWLEETHCDTVGKCRLSRVRGGDGPTHTSLAKTGTSSADTCSAFPVQRGRKSLQRTYRKEKRENYPIISWFGNEGLCSAYSMISFQPKRT